MFGMIQIVALPLLIPGYIEQVTGSFSVSGTALSFVGLVGFLAPVLGGFIDRFKLHAHAQQFALVLYGLSMLLLATSTQIPLFYLSTFLLGSASIILLSVNPTFIVSAGLSEEQENDQLVKMNQFIFIGAILAGLILWITMKLSYETSFFTLSGLSFVAVFITGIDNRIRAKFIILQTASPKEENGSKKSVFNLTLLLFLLGVFFGMFASSNQVAQGPGLFERLFDIPKSTTSLALSISSLITLFTLGAVGMWLKKVSPKLVWKMGLIGYGVVGLLLYYLSSIHLNSFILVLALHLIFMQALSVVDMVKPALIVKTSNLSPSMAQGFLLFAIAGGYAAGTVSGGFFADANGASSLFIFIALSALVAFVFAFISTKMMK